MTKKLSNSGAKKLLNVKNNLPLTHIQWCERWLIQLYQERSYPSQIVCADPMSVLSSILPTSMLSTLLDQLREEYKKMYPLLIEKEDFSFLTDIVDGR